MHQEFSYYAFISYSHKDEAFAKKVQHYLEHYKLPGILCRQYPHLPKNLRPIFRDKTDLPFDRLRESIIEALQCSKYLIVICSEASANPNDDGKNWIDWEIDTFVNLRPENVRRIIPILIKKDDSLDILNCLPPSIKKHEILTADVQEKGEARTLSDTVAKMVELKPDVLWNRHEREMRKKRFFRRLTAVATATFAVVGAWFYQDYYVPHDTYYTDYVECNNIPQGLFKLTTEQMEQRQFHYRFTKLKGQIIKVAYCNSGGTPVDHPGKWHIWHQERPAVMELTYKDETTLIERTHYNANGDEIVKMKFSDGLIDFAKPRKQGGTEQSIRINPTEFDLRKAKIVGFNVTRDRHGHIVQELYREPFNPRPATDSSGLCGRLYQLDELGRTFIIQFLGLSIQPDGTYQTIPTDQDNLQGYRITYGKEGGALGQVTKFEYIYKIDTPYLTTESRFKYDAAGNIIEEAHFDTNGKPIFFDKDRTAKMTWAYDAKGNVIEELYWNEEGAREEPIIGYSGIRKKYDEFNNVIQEDYIDNDDKPADYSPNRITRTYDKTGRRLIEELRYSPATNSNPNCIDRLRYDENNNVIEIAHLDKNGQPIMNEYPGYAFITNKYNGKNLIETTFRDEKGHPIMHPTYHYAQLTRQYDKNGNVKEETLRDEKGKLVLGISPSNHHTYQYARVTKIYDGTGNVIEEAYYDPNGKLYSAYDDGDWAKKTYRFNEQGNLEEVNYFNADNEPCEMYRMTNKFNQRGDIVEHKLLYKNPPPDVIVCTKYRYNELNQQTEEAYYNKDDQPIPDEEGCVRKTTTYTENGHLIESIDWDRHGKKIRSYRNDNSSE